MGLSNGRKSFQIGLAVLIHYRRVTDSQSATQPPSQTRCRSKYRAYCVAQVKVCEPMTPRPAMRSKRYISHALWFVTLPKLMDPKLSSHHGFTLLYYAFVPVEGWALNVDVRRLSVRLSVPYLT